MASEESSESESKQISGKYISYSLFVLVEKMVAPLDLDALPQAQILESCNKKSAKQKKS